MTDPYAPPSAAARMAPVDVPDALALRNVHLEYESALLALGWWYYFLALLQLSFGLMCLGMAFFLGFGDLPPDEELSPMALAAVMGVFSVLALGFGGLCAYAGWGVRGFAPESRIPGLINAGIQVTIFPFGMIAGVAGLYLLLQPAAKAVLSHHYQDVRAATPELKPRWHPLLWALPVTIVISAVGFGSVVALSVWAAIAQGVS